MIWATLRRGHWSLITAALGANALPILLFSALQHDGAINPADKSEIMMHVTLVGVHLLFFGIGVFGAIGPPSRLYAFPIRTSSLVALTLLQGMVAVAAELIVSTALLNAAFGLGWPLWGPALFAAAAFATVQAIFWLTEKSGWLVFAIGLAVAALGIWFKSRYGPAFSTPNRYWFVVTPLDVLTLLLTVVVAYCVAVAGVARNRCGQPPYSVGLVAWLDRISTATPKAGVAFRSPAQAQLWFEWRRKGWAMSAVVVMGLVAGLGIWLVAIRDGKALYEGFVAGGALFSLAAFLNGFVLGNVGRSDGDLQIGHFLATRPITTTQMAHSILKCAAKGLLVAWAIWAGSLLALDAILLALRVTFPLTLPAPLGWWYLPATLVGAWAAVGILAPVALAGRQKLAMSMIFGFGALLVGLLLFSKFALSREGQEQFLDGAVVACGIVLVVGTVAAFFAAHRRSLIGAPTLLIAASVWGLLCALVAIERLSHPGERLSVYLCAAGILALAVSPLATAPLALAWNRNR
jgi:hypothetical protein